MADDSSSRTTPPATTHSWWRTAALTLVVLLLLATVLIIFLERKRRVIFPLHDNVATQLVGSLTQKHDTFETRIWERRIYEKLPIALKDWIGTQWKPSGETVGATLPAGSVQFLFAVKPLQRPGQVDKETAFQLAQTEISDRVIGVRLKFGHGWYSTFSPLQSVTEFASTPAISDELLRSTFSDVPHTLEKLHLEVYHTVRGDESVLYSKEIDNPLYEVIEPIGAAVSLPASVSHNNVKVTLEAFASGTAGEFRRYSDSQGNSEYPDLQHAAFIRPAGTFGDAFHSSLAFHVSDANTTGCVWGIDDLEIFYGKSAIPISWAEKVNKPLERKDADGLLQAFVFDGDLAEFGQPVKIVARLIKRTGFVPDELRSVEFEMPVKGEVSRQKVLRVAGAGGFDQAGPARPRIALAVVANEAAIDSYQSWSPEGALVVRVDDVTKSERLHSVELLKNNGEALNLNQHALVHRRSDRHLSATYDLRNRRGWERTPAINTEDYEKVRVTVVTPPAFPAAFEFIAEPTPATVQATRVQ